LAKVKKTEKINFEDKWLDKTQKDRYEKILKKQKEQDKVEQEKQEILKLQERTKAEELENSKALIDELLENEKDKLRDEIDLSKGIPYMLFELSHKGIKGGAVKNCITKEYQLWTEEDGQEGSISHKDTNGVYAELKEDIPICLIPIISYSKDRIEELEKMYF